MFIMFNTDQTITEAGWEAVYSTAVGLNDNKNAPAIDVYPNPATDHLCIPTISDNSGEIQVQLSDINGLTVLMRKFVNNGTVTTIDVSNLNSGMYFLRITTGRGSVVRKVVIE